MEATALLQGSAELEESTPLLRCHFECQASSMGVKPSPGGAVCNTDADKLVVDLICARAVTVDSPRNYALHSKT